MKLFKTLIIVVVIGGLLLGASLPALAAGSVTNTQSAASFAPNSGNEGKGHWWEGKVEIVRGKVTGVPGDSGVPSDVIKVDDKDIHVTADTIYKVPGLGRAGTLSDIKDGMYIVAQCDKTDSGLQARYVIVVPGKSEYRYQHYTGTVTGYTYDPNAGGTITITDRSGNNTTTFTIIDGNFKILPAGATVQNGDWVTVVGYRESSSSQPIAVGVMVYPGQPSEVAWPGLERVTGVIHISGTTITVDTTPSVTVNYDDTTIFVLRGVPAADGQTATVFYQVQSGGTNDLAKFVLVGTDLPRIMAGLGKPTTAEPAKESPGSWNQGI